MTKDLKDHVLIKKDTVKSLVAILDKIELRGGIRGTCLLPTETSEAKDALVQAINQDLSEMVVVPIEPTEEMCRAGQKHMPRDDLGYVIVDAEYIYAAMLSAAQKEKNDD